MSKKIKKKISPVHKYEVSVIPETIPEVESYWDRQNELQGEDCESSKMKLLDFIEN